MVGNTKQRGVGDLFKRALMALYLLKILEATPFFYNGGSDPRNVKLSDKVAMGAVLLKHLQVTNQRILAKPMACRNITLKIKLLENFGQLRLPR